MMQLWKVLQELQCFYILFIYAQSIPLEQEWSSNLTLQTLCEIQKRSNQIQNTDIKIYKNTKIKTKKVPLTSEIQTLFPL